MSSGKADPRHTFGLFLAIACCILLVDQLVKALVVAFMTPYKPICLVPGLVDLTYSINKGAAFGIMNGNGTFLFILNLLILLLLLAWAFLFRKELRTLQLFGFGLMVGGALGNVVDRLFRGRVVDYIDLGWWPVFNLADIGIVVGAIIIIFSYSYAIFVLGKR